MADDNIPPLDPAELDMILEEVHGAPIPRAAAQGIADMQARIRLLTVQKTLVVRAMANASEAMQAMLSNDLDKLNSALTEAHIRLKEYETQQAGRN